MGRAPRAGSGRGSRRSTRAHGARTRLLELAGPEGRQVTRSRTRRSIQDVGGHAKERLARSIAGCGRGSSRSGRRSRSRRPSRLQSRRKTSVGSRRFGRPEADIGKAASNSDSRVLLDTQAPGSLQVFEAALRVDADRSTKRSTWSRSCGRPAADAAARIRRAFARRSSPVSGRLASPAAPRTSGDVLGRELETSRRSSEAEFTRKRAVRARACPQTRFEDGRARRVKESGTFVTGSRRRTSHAMASTRMARHRRSVRR